MDLEGAPGINTNQKTIDNFKNPTSQQNLGRVSSDKCENQDHRIGKIRRFKKCLDKFLIETSRKLKGLGKHSIVVQTIRDESQLSINIYMNEYS